MLGRCFPDFCAFSWAWGRPFRGSRCALPLLARGGNHRGLAAHPVTARDFSVVLPRAVKEQTAQATADVKRDAKAVAAGISEGWSRDKQLDLNTATKDQLLSLPGVTAAEADRVIAGRPYGEAGDVVTRRIMPKTEYDRIADRVTAKK